MPPRSRTPWSAPTRRSRSSARFPSAAERATADRLAAERSLAGAREVVRQGREAIKAARIEVKRAEATPETAPRSTITLLLGWQQVVTEGTPLSVTEREVVRGLVESMATMVGADKSLIRRGYDQGVSDLQDSFNDRIQAVPGQTGQVVIRDDGRRR